MSRVIITLVHGTFASDGAWYRDKSGFRQQLTQQLSEAFPKSQIVYDDTLFAADKYASQEAFQPDLVWGKTGWSRRWLDNTNGARAYGKSLLKDRIGDIANNHLQPNDRHYVIAHSHGGNIALYALRGNSSVDGLICLATPFLYPRRSPFPLTIPWLCLIVLSLALVGPANSVDLANNAGVNLIPQWNLGVWSFAPLLRNIVLCGFAIALLALTFFNLRSDSKKLDDHIQELKFDDVTTPVLLVRGSGDEASFLLRWGQFANWCSRLTIKLLGKPAKWIFLPPIILFLFHFLMPPLNAAEAEGGDWLITNVVPAFKSATNFLLALMTGFVPILFLLLTVARWTFGFDTAQWTCHLETMAEDCPPGLQVTACALTPVDGPTKGMVHSVYDRPETASLIATWCKHQHESVFPRGDSGLTGT